MPIQNLEPAKKEEVTPYNPYYSQNKRNWLPLALSLYREGRLEGQRPIEAGKPVPFVATWTISSLPLEPTSCRIQFDGNAELSYELSSKNEDFMGYLIEVVRNYQKEGIVDFPQEFYSQLFNMPIT